MSNREAIKKAFDEQFPSFNYEVEGWDEAYSGTIKECLIELCLDKSKVKEAIEKLSKEAVDKDGEVNYSSEKIQYADSDGYYGYSQALEDLKKELGLE